MTDAGWMYPGRWEVVDRGSPGWPGTGAGEVGGAGLVGAVGDWKR